MPRITHTLILALSFAASTLVTPIPTADADNLRVARYADPPSEASRAGVARATPRRFTIEAKTSEARFFIDEKLLGRPKTVVGRTSKVRGGITLDLAGASGASFEPIRVDAADLTTDNTFRNRAIRDQILESDEKPNRYIVFAPSRVDSMPDPRAVAVGEAVAFEVAGHLTIREITQPVTFAMTVTPLSATRLAGSGSATIKRSDFDIGIPKLKGLADLSDDVRLEVDFLMKAD